MSRDAGSAPNRMCRPGRAEVWSHALRDLQAPLVEGLHHGLVQKVRKRSEKNPVVYELGEKKLGVYAEC